MTDKEKILNEGIRVMLARLNAIEEVLIKELGVPQENLAEKFEKYLMEVDNDGNE